MERQTLITKFDNKQNFRLIQYDEILEKEHELHQITMIEKDIVILNEIMRDFHNIVESQGIAIQTLENNVSETKNLIENANADITESINIKNDTIVTKIGIATIAIVTINTPIGLILGTKILLCTLLTSGVVSAIFIAKT